MSQTNIETQTTNQRANDKALQLVNLAVVTGVVEGLVAGAITSKFGGKLQRNMLWSLGLAISTNLVMTGLAIYDVNNTPGSWADLQVIASDLIIGSAAAVVGSGISLLTNSE